MSQRFETLQLHAGQSPASATTPRAVPLYQTSSYASNAADHDPTLIGQKDLANIYTRLINPPTAAFEKPV